MSTKQTAAEIFKAANDSDLDLTNSISEHIEGHLTTLYDRVEVKPVTSNDTIFQVSKDGHDADIRIEINPDGAEAPTATMKNPSKTGSGTTYDLRNKQDVNRLIRVIEHKLAAKIRSKARPVSVPR